LELTLMAPKVPAPPHPEDAGPISDTGKVPAYATKSRPRITKAGQVEPLPDDHQTSFGRNVRAVRFAQGWTQADLATAANLTHQYISRVEDGRVNITLASMRRIAAALGVQLVVLLVAPAPDEHDEAATPLE